MTNKTAVQAPPADAELIRAQAKRLESAKTWFVFNEPFYGFLIFHLTDRHSDAVPTMATDGRSLLWNSAFTQTLQDFELRAVYLHEIMHCAYRHMTRRSSRDPLLWNIAGDLEINELIDHSYKNGRSTGLRLPVHGLRHPPYFGMPVELIYNELLKNATKVTVDAQGMLDAPGNGKPTGKGQNGPPELDGKQLIGDVLERSEAERQQIDADWKQAVLHAANHVSQSHGDLPEFAKRLLSEIKEPKQSWRALLHDWFNARTTTDYSWSQPSRRYSGSGFILPSLGNPCLGTVVLVVDTSGSIDGPVLDKFISEMNGLLRDCRPNRMHVLSVDAAVHSVYELTPEDDIPTEYQGGGGTSFIPAFEWVEANRMTWEQDLVCLVYFTDGMGTFPKAPPDYPVLWALTGECKLPFGVPVELWLE